MIRARSANVPAGGTGWTHDGAASDSVHNYYYLVQGVNGTGVRSGPSNGTAKFSFTLTPGTP